MIAVKNTYINIVNSTCLHNFAQRGFNAILFFNSFILQLLDWLIKVPNILQKPLNYLHEKKTLLKESECSVKLWAVVLLLLLPLAVVVVVPGLLFITESVRRSSECCDTH